MRAQAAASSLGQNARVHVGTASDALRVSSVTFAHFGFGGWGATNRLAFVAVFRAG